MIGESVNVWMIDHDAADGVTCFEFGEPVRGIIRKTIACAMRYNRMRWQWSVEGKNCGDPAIASGESETLAEAIEAAEKAMRIE